MAFDDDSRLVIEEGLPATAAPSRPPSSSAGKRINTSAVGAPIPTPPRERRRGKPDGYGTVSCVQTFSNGLVVTATSEGTVSQERTGSGVGHSTIKMCCRWNRDIKAWVIKANT